MWLIFLYWLIKSSDHSIEITLFCEDWQTVIKLNSIVANLYILDIWKLLETLEIHLESFLRLLCTCSCS
ncbi:hypothetical protein SLEP1_g26257 [Rubroshorea leprosula]|uniref:Uncharacterized protein n=1 Tax=Rubroshorea leprosula TaxID=152421 RepID=A0AAV5JW07_9ROSI|nr:hypothetical protein SLEP1_g26257 [Rubroshorea leprosula]